MTDGSPGLNPWLGYALSIVLVLAAAEIGRLLGTFSLRRYPNDTVAPHLLTLEGAALGLLALMIGFTFSMALSRFDVRQNQVLDEANAIGTVALRAQFLSKPDATEVKNLLNQYVQLRIDLSRGEQTAEALQTAIHHSNDLQAQLWHHAVAVSAADPHSIPSGLFVQSLNDMIDLQEKRLTAARNHVPPAAFLLLYAITIVSVGLSGYVSGLAGGRGRVPVAVVAVLVASVIGIIIDIDRSRSGFIRVSQQAMYDLQESMGEQ
jgi:hypothetical protein